MTNKLDIDNLARECGGTHKLSLGVYQFYKDELTAYTHAVMEACAKVYETQKYMVLDPLRTYSADDLCKAQKSAATHLAAAIREMMP